MFIVLINIIHQITQSDYDAILRSISLRETVCPHCGGTGFHIYRKYRRLVKNGDYPEKTVLFIQRVRCSHCGRTHAILPATIVPYSQTTMADTVRIIQAGSAEEAKEILDENLLLGEKDIYRTRLRYRSCWKERIAEIEGAAGEGSFLAACIRKFRMHFMQIPPTLAAAMAAAPLLWDALPL